MSSVAVIWGGSAIVFILVMTVTLAFALNSRSKRRGRVLSIISGEGADTNHQEKAEKKKASSPKEIAARLKLAGQQTKAGMNKKSLSALIAQAGFETPVLRFWIYSVVFAAFMVAVLTTMGFSKLIIVLLGFTSLFGLPRFYLKFKAKRRQKAFLHDFADALEAMIRLLKAGMPVTEAITMVGNEFSGPVGEEMARIAEEQRVGTPIGDAVQRASIRMPIPEVKMFSTAITIQAQTGSSLSEVLGNLSGVIRARYRLKRKVQALSSEAKVSAMIIGALPVMVSGALYAVNRDYIELLWTTETGKMLSYGALTWMTMGILVMRQMINFKV